MLFILSAPVLAVGTVNSDACVPFAAMSSTGNSLLVGDLKTLIFWEDRVSALTWNETCSRFSGGIGTSTAIACSNQQTYVFDSTRSPQNPSGKWTKLQVDGPRLCAMVEDSFVILVNNKLYINDQIHQVNLEGPMELVISGSRVLALSPKGLAYDASCQCILQHPYKSNFTSTTRFHANSHQMIKVDGEQVDLLTFDATKKQLFSEWYRIPVNPCQMNEICQPSIANDNSWFISGYWGHFYGKGKTWIRLKYPLASLGTSGVAVAHQKMGGKFVYLGNDDGDMGSLPELPSTSLQGREWSVWSKDPPGRLVDDKLYFKTVKRLPKRIPKSWIAWEPNTELPIHSPPFNVPYFPSASTTNWWADYLKIDQTWSLNNNASFVKIAVIDSGALMSHPALNFYKNPNEVPNNGIDDDDNGFVDDVRGYDFVKETFDIHDELGHGTHVTGILVGQGPQLKAVAKNGQVIVIRALDKGGKSTSIDLARALYYAIEQEVEVINCSWGGGGTTQALRDAFDAVYKAGILVFSSAGNAGVNTDKEGPEVPKNFPGVVAIGAINQKSQIPSYSNYGGKTVTFLAPGDSILSTSKDGGYISLSGTSMASPMALSCFVWIYGLLKSKFPTTPKIVLRNQTLQVLCSTATQKGVQGKSKCGIIRLYEAAQQVRTL